MFRYVLWLLAVPCSVFAESGPPPRVLKEVKQAVQDGLTFLTNDSREWRTARACASCHHVPLTLWAVNDAKRYGYAVDQATADDLTTWVFAKNDPAKVFPKQPMPEAMSKGPKLPEGTFVNQAALLLALGIQAGDKPSEESRTGLKNLLATVLRGQEKDGSWRIMFEWQPIASSPDVITTLALLALTSANAPDMGDEGKNAKDKGLQWLTKTKPSDTVQAWALRVILWQRLGRPASDCEPLVKQIAAAQNGDGGWSAAQGLSSDAYTTGQALYALTEAGTLPDTRTIRLGQTYLLVNQHKDGSWEMTSRPGQPHGKSAKNTEPIAHVGSAWAIMGLARSAPKSK